MRNVLSAQYGRYVFYAICLLLSGFAVSIAGAQPNDLIDQYKNSLRWIETHQHDGLILRTDPNHFRGEVRDGRSFKGVVIRSSPLREGENVKGLPHWYATQITDSTVVLRYAGARFNAFVVRSLLRMYQATGNYRYLRNAKRRVDALLDELENGKWMRLRRSDPEMEYIARVNSFVLQAAARHAEVAGEKYDPRLRDMARSYSFTDEGVWNHWSSATIGLAIRARILNRPFTGRGKIESALDTLHAQIRRHDGKIPYIQDPSHPAYPDFRGTYQTLDAMVLARMTAKTSVEVGILSSYLWPLIWGNAIDVNYGNYWANNTVTALHLFEATGWTYDGWIERQREKPIFRRPPRSLPEAIAKLRATSALALYSTLSDETETDSNVVVSPPRPNPSSSTVQFSIRTQISGRITFSLYDALGRQVRTRQSTTKPRTIRWERIDVGSLSAGPYFLRVRTSGFSRVFKLTVL